jgi:hypothetical protein
MTLINSIINIQASKGLKGFSVLIILIATLFNANAQITVSGKVLDKKGEPLPGANIFIKGSFDGATSNAEGKYSFKTDEQGDQVIITSFIGYTTSNQAINLTKSSVLIDIVLTEAINKIDGVVITAGAFEASDVKKAVVLKPLDIAMTAGATADISGALNTLPGTQNVGESGRLFVRGGESHETRVFVDGLQVNNFFGISAPNTPARGRFSPFLFKGTTFSTGGYSAEYGQALSSALLLSSNDFPEEERTDISIMSIGLGAAKTKIYNRTSITAEASYSNLSPYFGLIRQNVDWQKAPSSAEASLVFRQKVRSNGLFKIYGNFNKASLEMSQDDLNNPDNSNRFNIGNGFYYLNASYKDIFGNWIISGGSSIGFTKETIRINADNRIKDRELNIHSKLVATKDLHEKVALRIGGEVMNDAYSQNLHSTEFDYPLELRYNETLSSAFVETDIYLSNKLLFRGGARAERSGLLDKYNIAPRLSLAYKTDEKGQFSLAYGEFFQSPQKHFLRWNNQLDYTQATHYILNYQRIQNNRIFRIEGYRKVYNKLIKFDQGTIFNPVNLTNLGTGYANGVDLFIRDRKTIKNGDYWISYSLLDSKRNHYDFQEISRVSLFSTHNFSAVYKHFIPKTRTQIGATYSFTSGRPYHDPNKTGFMNSKTPAFNNLSFNAAYLYKPNIILYFSATNIPGFQNIFGYRFSNSPDENGVFARQAIIQPAPRFLFLGLFITLSKNKETNQLEHLN